MNTSDPVRDKMRAIKLANPDVDVIELIGIKEEDSWNGKYIQETFPGKTRWKVRITFIDEDFFETKLYKDMMEPLEAAEERLGRWMRL